MVRIHERPQMLYNILIFYFSAVFCAFIFVLISPLFLPIEIVEFYSKSFNYLGIGFAAFFGGIAGVSSLIDLQKKKRRREIYLNDLDDYRNLYPVTSLGESFEVVQFVGENEVYVHDKIINKYRHISNPETLSDLGFNYGMRKLIIEKPNDIKYGDKIHTRSKGEIFD